MNSEDAMYQEQVNCIDPSLAFKRLLSHHSTFVCQVEKSGFYVLKACYAGSDEEKYMSRESHILQMAAGVEGITHLIHDYENTGRYRAILKEYFHGFLQNSKERTIKIGDKELQEFLTRTVGEIHGIGFASLDIRSPNIVISDDRKNARIVDLNTYSAQDEVEHDEFERKKEYDFSNLKMLFA